MPRAARLRHGKSIYRGTVCGQKRFKSGSLHMRLTLNAPPQVVSGPHATIRGMPNAKAVYDRPLQVVPCDDDCLVLTDEGDWVPGVIRQWSRYTDPRGWIALVRFTTADGSNYLGPFAPEDLRPVGDSAEGCRTPTE